MKKLVVAPNSVLRKVSKPVEEVDKNISKLVVEMIKYMCKHSEDGLNRPLGLAAVQLGEPVRIFVFTRSPGSTDQNDIQVLINPEIVAAKGSHFAYESCLSLPDRTFYLKRAKVVKVRGLNLDWEPRSFRGRDMLAQVFQHEINHLDGILLDAIGKEMKNGL